MTPIEIIERAQQILRDYLPPDGISKDEAITRLLDLFDGPEVRAAQANPTSNPTSSGQ